MLDIANNRGMSMFPGLPDMSSLVDKRREFSEERILGYSPEKVYDVVADLNRYVTRTFILRKPQITLRSPYGTYV